MSRRRKLILLIVGMAVASVGGLLLALFLSSSPPSPVFDVGTKDIPADWLGTDDRAEIPSPPTVETDVPPEASDGEPIASPEVSDPAEETEPPAEPIVSSGTLALVGDGKPFGEEAYELTITEDRATLQSSGRFWFKVVLATVQVSFEQTFEGDGDLRPILYVAEFHAPLGFDRSIRATVEGDEVTIERSGGQEEIAIRPQNTFTLGTFSTYVLLPRLFGLRGEDGAASFEVLVFGGPPDQANATDLPENGLPVMTVERTGTASLRAGENRLTADCYTVSSQLGESELFARDDEFLAFRAGDDDRSLWVYRSDFFPDGVEVVGLTP